MMARASRLTRRGVAAGTLGMVAASLMPRSLDHRTRAYHRNHEIAARLTTNLSLTEKIAQLFMIPALGTTMTPEFHDQLATDQPGGVILVGANFGTPDEVVEFASAIHATNPDLPSLIALDQEGGPVSRLPDDPAPGAPELGQESDAEVSVLARARAELVRAYGFEVNFAPVADVAYSAASSMAGRAFGADPALVAAKVGAYVAGVAGTGVHHAVKHFPGHGRATLDSHDALPTVDLSLADWWEADGLPFRTAIGAGAEMVMLGHLRYSRWDDAPASLSPVAVELLRRDLGFGGVIVSDDLGMAALGDLDPFAVVDRAIGAGVDLLLYVILPVPARELIAHLVTRVETGVVPAARVDASVRRLLQLRMS